ncbi:MAG TPA: carboxypeptidase-like regulatory domain-containing protein [Candidatus Thermoplasmatota archaeon]|nr:carboxypeptidase-like regulatory domain-containing protein [Candidatus Thermoplasmatota archaeon]
MDRLTIVLIIAAVAGCSSPVGENSPSACMQHDIGEHDVLVTGRVLGAQSRPVEAVRIIVIKAGSPGNETISDAGGCYALSAGEGDWIVRATKEGYRPEEVPTGSLTAPREVVIDFAIHQIS